LCLLIVGAAQLHDSVGEFDDVQWAAVWSDVGGHDVLDPPECRRGRSVPRPGEGAGIGFEHAAQKVHLADDSHEPAFGVHDRERGGVPLVQDPDGLQPAGPDSDMRYGDRPSVVAADDGNGAVGVVDHAVADRPQRERPSSGTDDDQIGVCRRRRQHVGRVADDDVLDDLDARVPALPGARAANR
jgi:hypothetical protein